MNFREVYLIRHGATALNVEGGGPDRIRGWKNVPLSVHGRQEVEQLSWQLANSGLKTLCASDMERARDTAKAVSKTTNAKVLTTPQLRPWNLGEFTGMESSSVHPEIVKYAVRKPNMRVPGGEAFNEFKERAFSGLRGAIRKVEKDYLGLVTHHRVERLVKAWIAAGQTADFDLDFDVMFQRGEATAHAEIISLNLDNLLAAEYL